MTELESSCSNNERPAETSSMRFADRLARSIVMRQLNRLESGQLVLIDQHGRHQFGNSVIDSAPKAEITVADSRFFMSVVAGGSIGAAEAYMQGYWSCDDLTEVVRLLVRNRDVLDDMEKGTARLATPLRKLLNWTNRNTRAGSRRNIAAHYDLGNDFFHLWLDETMMYSSAVFERADMSLGEASVAKLDRLCRKLELCPSDHVLEIGTGWGGFAIHAAKNYGCRVTSTTISREQLEYAQARVDEEALGDRITLLLKDYRDLEGQYDKLVSIEMIEAVGHEFLDVYFATCSNLLKADGMMMLQAITIQDQRYEAALKTVDFIKRYIFPGGFIPSVTAMLQSIRKSSDMRIYHLEDIGEHYAKTLDAWRHAFHRNLGRIRSMGYAEEFLRMWNFYFCYCEGAFLERAIGNAQILFVKPGCRRSSIVPTISSDRSN
jgi:cyclopropane-fatty-acyl-phospholipid synthase